ncbi:MAG: PaaI family thioesterase [Acidimicrobiales bacterium]
MQRPLDNAEWGFESHCFVCEASNERGLRIPFVHDDEADVVTAEFCLGEEFSGAPRFVHGGLVSALLDEAMAWAAIAVGGRFAVTAEMTTTFERPVKVGHTYSVEATIDTTDESEGDGDRVGQLSARARITDAAGRCCAQARGCFVALNADTIQAATGRDPGEREAGLLDGGVHQG